LFLLHAVEAVFLLIPWESVAQGLSRFHFTQGLVTWVAVPGFAAFSGLTRRYGPNVWTRFGSLAWTLVWILLVELLPRRSTQFETFWYLAGPIFALNLIVVLGPFLAVLLRPSLASTILDTADPSGLWLGLTSWLIGAIAVIAFVVQHGLGWGRSVFDVVLPLLVMLSPLVALIGVFQGVVELRCKQRLWGATGVAVSGAFLLFFPVLVGACRMGNGAVRV
jgi:hypothetical protein